MNNERKKQCIVEQQIDRTDYKRLIIDMIRQIDDNTFLRRIYISLRDYIKEKSE
ncbi:MAG: hypothetical protein UFG06_13805 [Lachnospiraceae bacterium]|nr:hypothetical protein [Lachnospiraceae bacterium]